MRDYPYIKEHIKAYEDIYNEVVQDINEHMPEEMMAKTPEYVREQGYMVAFYQHLIRHKMMSVPKHCKVCPFHDVLFNATGMIIDICCINTKFYAGDCFFAHRGTKPEWCPAEQIVTEE